MERYVLDTSGLIAYFDEIFRQSKRLSEHANSIISEALYSRGTPIRLTVPSIAFVEVFEKWLTADEILRRFYYEAFVPIEESPNVEVRGIDEEILRALIGIGHPLDHHEIHDKLIVACSVVLDSHLITSDEAVANYVEAHSLPKTIW
ncbi:MAG TPA: hypothetical protein VGC60_16355 [Pyrinomonadaceae bacterium]|jgi:hypothetical protein